MFNKDVLQFTSFTATVGAYKFSKQQTRANSCEKCTLFSPHLLANSTHASVQRSTPTTAGDTPPPLQRQPDVAPTHMSLAGLRVANRGEDGVDVGADELLVLLATDAGGHTAHQERSFPGSVRVEGGVQMARHRRTWRGGGMGLHRSRRGGMDVTRVA